MTKTIVTLAAVLGLSTAAYAADPAPAPSMMDKIDLAFVTDTEYNIDTEKAQTEFGIEAGISGFSLSAKPTMDWDASDINNVAFGAQYDIDVMDRLTVSPYGEYNVNKDFEEVSKIVGVKTRIQF
jgi:hypothetical protein